MSEHALTPVAAPAIGFVSLGCPKALTDSELILTRLSAEGYRTSKTSADADLVIVNTCGFIDAAVEESLAAIGEALAENGKVIVTGCLGAKEGVVQSAHPDVLAVTGPHDVDGVKPRAGMVEKKERSLLTSRNQLRGKLQSLRLTGAQGSGGLAQLEVIEPNVHQDL